MVQKAAPKTTRKLKDKWKMKEWYSILAPDMFNRQKICETLTDEPNKLLGRVVEVTAQDLTGDFTKMHIKLHFKVDEVKGEEAHTFFLRQNLTSDYIRRLARRKRTRIEETYDIKTRDKVLLRMRPIAITEQRIASSKQTLLRKMMGVELEKIAGETLLNDFVMNIISGQLSRRIAAACKHINIINRIEIRKTEFLSQEEYEGVEPAEVPEAEAPAEEQVESAAPEEVTEPEEAEEPEELGEPERSEEPAAAPEPEEPDEPKTEEELEPESPPEDEKEPEEN